MNYLNLVNTTCDCCGNKSVILNEIRSIYRIHGMIELCESCGKGSSKFIHYYGKKKQSDLARVKQFFNSGQVVTNKFSAQMNAGYF